MNQRQAFKETLEAMDARLIVARTYQLLPELSPQHLHDMYERLTDDMSDAKLGRWLGWAQCAVVAMDIGFTLEDMKAINQKWSD